MDVCTSPRLPAESADPPQPQPSSSRPAKGRRRARAVCRRCHEKKIKCDLESRRRASNQPCFNCAHSKSECSLRPSRRNARPIDSEEGTTASDFQGRLLPSMSETFNDISYSNRQPNAYGLLSLPPATQPGSGQRPRTSGISLTQAPLGSPATGNTPVDPLQHAFGAVNPLVTDDQPALESGHPSSQNPQASYLDESGYMPLLSHKQPTPSQPSGGPTTIDIHVSIHPLSSALRLSYTEIVLKHCRTFCPVLDGATLQIPEFQNSLALQQSIGLVGSAIQPSLLHHDSPATYYENAKRLIQGGYEPNPLAAIIAVMLFYWRAASPPTVVSMDSVWWWVGVSVRQAQEIGLHREPKMDQPLRAGESIGLRRRIWWTLFWIRLCTIVGRVGDHLRRNPSSTQVHQGLLDELRNWAHALPEALQLPFSNTVTSPSAFDADLYQLHLPYLACITLLHLKKSAHSIPTAYPAAILSASCTARIFEEFLVRGSLRFLQGMSGWYTAVAILALLYGRRDSSLQHAADSHIRVLRIALREMGKYWGSAKMYDISIEKLLNREHMSGFTADTLQENVDLGPGTGAASKAPASFERQDGPNKYFPGTSTQTSPLFELLLPNDEHTPFSELDHANDLSFMLYDIFDNPVDGVNYDLSGQLTGWGMSPNQ
ncbi:hypothetical protein FE257_001700 [Aspergillus nanangensis]|uniref:Zn(2)-C6 fungal-type domain-containing protein n=1 Tax=Aspergillus nanangensis TaxID=2582783 RepID=A0AAD4CDX6_ASPNN|nr:hypothetical protein FE257_001700 [Aspergillus nanangensis]